MRGKPGPFGLLALTAALFAFAFAAPAAVHADTGDIIEEQHTPPNDEDGFQAGTCLNDGVWPDQCSPDDPPALFYTQAAGHPPIGFTQYIVKQTEIAPGVTIPLGSVATIRVDLPAGLTINPEATARCTMEQFQATTGGPYGGVPFEVGCPEESRVGWEEVTLKVVAEPGAGTVVAPITGVTKVPLFNIVPEFGEPARFGFKIGQPGEKRPVFLEGDVDWSGDYHQGFTIKLPEGSPGTRTWKSRLVNEGRAGDGTYITTPTTCFDPKSGVYSTFLRAQAKGSESPTFPQGFTPWEATLPPGVQSTGCELVPFTPSLDVTPGTNQVDSPAAPEVTVELPFNPDPNGLEQSHVKNASIALAPGFGLNPSAANGLVACSDAQFGKGTRNAVTCPEASKIGTAHVETQPLPPGSLSGDVYLGAQQGFNPESGNMFRIFINPVSARYGVDVRLIGNISANRDTGQLTATLAENPQVPFESVKLKLDPAKQTLTSPPTCGPNQTNSAMEPWARPGTTVNPSSSFTLTSFPGGGPCPATLAERPFGPGHSADVTSKRAGKFTTFNLDLSRPDGAQEFRQVNVKLPPGLVAKLRNLDYCPEQRIEDAEAKSGASELPTPPPACPDKSFLGTSVIHAGSGPNPFRAPGNVYFAGPYKGAPISLAFITPAVAGPFDLGNTVVRVALHVDPETVRVTAVSDPIPHVFGGVKLSIRNIDVSIYRKSFTMNPTNCARKTIATDVFGGGANPNDPGAWSKVERSSRFKPTRCGALKFKPRFSARIFGGKKQTQRTANPKFRAILWGHWRHANVRRAAFILPRATILDQSHIRTICTRVQLAADNCPKGSIYGYARARSLLLSEVLKGPVYLTSSDNPLPDLVADLKGQVNVRVRGVISSVNGRLKTVFPRVPDVKVRKFILVMHGGNRGLLVNSQNLCERPRFSTLNLKAHNGKRENSNRVRLRVDACRN